MSAEQQIAKCLKCGAHEPYHLQRDCDGTFAPEIAPEATPPERIWMNAVVCRDHFAKPDPDHTVEYVRADSIDTLKRQVTHLGIWMESNNARHGTK